VVGSPASGHVAVKIPVRAEKVSREPSRLPSQKSVRASASVTTSTRLWVGMCAGCARVSLGLLRVSSRIRRDMGLYVIQDSRRAVASFQPVVRVGEFELASPGIRAGQPASIAPHVLQVPGPTPSWCRSVDSSRRTTGCPPSAARRIPAGCTGARSSRCSPERRTHAGAGRSPPIAGEFGRTELGSPTRAWHTVFCARSRALESS
jgi:hypothetical protein